MATVRHRFLRSYTSGAGSWNTAEYYSLGSDRFNRSKMPKNCEIRNMDLTIDYKKVKHEHANQRVVFGTYPANSAIKLSKKPAPVLIIFVENYLFLLSLNFSVVSSHQRF